MDPLTTSFTFVRLEPVLASIVMFAIDTCVMPPLVLALVVSDEIFSQFDGNRLLPKFIPLPISEADLAEKTEMRNSDE